MPLPKMNTDLLSKIVTWAYADHNQLNEFMNDNFPGWGSWNQGAWAEEVRNGVCKTAFCIAGQVVSQSNFVLNLEFEDETIYDFDNDAYVPTGKKIGDAETCTPGFVTTNSKGKAVVVPDPEAEPVSISLAASEILGLSGYEAEALFAGTNSISKVIYLAMSFARLRDQSLDISDEIVDIASVYSFENLLDYIPTFFWMKNADDIPYSEIVDAFNAQMLKV
jgi:hypothetical protein